MEVHSRKYPHGWRVLVIEEYPNTLEWLVCYYDEIVYDELVTLTAPLKTLIGKIDSAFSQSPDVDDLPILITSLSYGV
jgi:hypothetical protein